MAGQTENYHIYYPTDYDEIADVPENDRQQALSIEAALALIDLRNIVGDPTQLETTIKTSVVEAINELKGETDDIGDLTQLETTIKNNLVNAINELKTNTYNKTQTDTLLNGKQNTLTAGTNITIENDVISATGGEGSGGESLPVGTEVDYYGSVAQIPDGWEVSDDIVYNNSTGTNGNITFSESISGASEIEIIYCRRRASTGTSVFKTTGKLPYSSGMEIALDINYYSNDTNQQSIAKIVVVTASGLTVTGENTMQESGGQVVTSATTNIYITKVTVYR